MGEAYAQQKGRKHTEQKREVTKLTWYGMISVYALHVSSISSPFT